MYKIKKKVDGKKQEPNTDEKKPHHNYKLREWNNLKWAMHDDSVGGKAKKQTHRESKWKPKQMVFFFQLKHTHEHTKWNTIIPYSWESVIKQRRLILVSFIYFIFVIRCDSIFMKRILGLFTHGHFLTLINYTKCNVDVKRQQIPHRLNAFKYKQCEELVIYLFFLLVGWFVICRLWHRHWKCIQYLLRLCVCVSCFRSFALSVRSPLSRAHKLQNV